jgi:hypothetical protein
MNKLASAPGQFMSNLSGMAHDPIGSAAGMMKQTGDVVENMGEAVGGAAGKLGVFGAVLAGIATLAVGLHKLVGAYMKNVEQGIEMSASMGKTGHTLVQNMDIASKAALKFGYSAQQGMAIMTSLARLGVTGGEDRTGEVASEIMGFQRGTGASVDMLQKIAGYGGRFRKDYTPESIIRTLYGGFKKTGIKEDGRFEEYAGTNMSMIEDALSRGVVKGATQSARVTNFMYGGGEIFRGPQGQQVMMQMQAAIAGATGLSSQRDALLYRAAKDVMGTGAGFIDVQKKLEEGLTPEMLNSVRKRIMQQTGGNMSDATQMFHETYGLSYTQSQALLGMGEASTKAQIDEITAPPADKNVIDQLKAQETLTKAIMDLGAKLQPAEKWAMEKLAGGAEFLAGVDKPGVKGVFKDIATFGQQTVDELRRIGAKLGLEPIINFVAPPDRVPESH